MATGNVEPGQTWNAVAQVSGKIVELHPALKKGALIHEGEVIPVVLIAVLSVSLVEAFLILPHHLAHALKGHEQDSRRLTGFRRRFDHGMEWLRNEALGSVVDLVIHWRYLFVGLVIALFMVSVGMLAGGHLKRVAFPDIDGDSIEARLLLPQGTPLWRTRATVNKITGALQRVDDHYTPLQPEKQHLIRDVSVRYNQNRDANEPGTHVATISVEAQILIPLVTSIVFGLLMATALVLLVVPAIFSIFDDLGWVTIESTQASEGK